MSQYKYHIPNSRKGECHRVFDEKGREKAIAFGLKQGLLLSTMRSWTIAWRHEQEAIKAKAKRPAKAKAKAKASPVKEAAE